MPNITAYVHAYVGMDHNAGAETTLHDILKHLVKSGWEAIVILKDRRGISRYEYEVDGVKVIQADSKREILHWIPRSDVTITHLECSERTHILSNNYGIPTIHLVHNTHPLTIKWQARATALIVNTDWIANEPEWLGFNKPKMVIYPPVNPDDYETDHGKCVTLVNLWEDKGSEIFYEMAKRFPNVPFLGVKGGYGAQVIRELPNVTIMDHTDNMRSVYSQSKIMLMPSKYESFGRVGVEAAASGIPTIAHPTPGLLESLGDSGTFADREDLDAWEEALRDLLKPVKYGRATKTAKARSKELAKKREEQLDTMEFFLEELIRRKVK